MEQPYRFLRGVSRNALRVYTLSPDASVAQAARDEIERRRAVPRPGGALAAQRYEALREAETTAIEALREALAVSWLRDWQRPDLGRARPVALIREEIACLRAIRRVLAADAPPPTER